MTLFLFLCFINISFLSSDNCTGRDLDLLFLLSPEQYLTHRDTRIVNEFMKRKKKKHNLFFHCQKLQTSNFCLLGITLPHIIGITQLKMSKVKFLQRPSPLTTPQIILPIFIHSLSERQHSGYKKHLIE